MLRDLRRDRLRSLDDAGAGPPTGLDGGESCYALRYRSALGRRDDFGGSSDRARATSITPGGGRHAEPVPISSADIPQGSANSSGAVGSLRLDSTETRTPKPLPHPVKALRSASWSGLWMLRIATWNIVNKTPSEMGLTSSPKSSFLPTRKPDDSMKVRKVWASNTVFEALAKSKFR